MNRNSRYKLWCYIHWLNSNLVFILNVKPFYIRASARKQKIFRYIELFHFNIYMLFFVHLYKILKAKMLLNGIFFRNGESFENLCRAQNNISLIKYSIFRFMFCCNWILYRVSVLVKGFEKYFLYTCIILQITMTWQIEIHTLFFGHFSFFNREKKVLGMK